VTPDQVICPFCTRSVKTFDDFCPWCEKPLTTFATTDPLQSIRAEGDMIRSSMNRPTPIVLVGMCLLFGLPFIFFLVVAFIFLFDSSGVNGIVGGICKMELGRRVLWNN